MRDYNAISFLLTERPTQVNAKEAVAFCLERLYVDCEHDIDEEICHRLTYEELIGALLLAQDVIGEAEANKNDDDE